MSKKCWLCNKEATRHRTVWSGLGNNPSGTQLVDLCSEHNAKLYIKECEYMHKAFMDLLLEEDIEAKIIRYAVEERRRRSES